MKVNNGDCDAAICAAKERNMASEVMNIIL
jgi:hypothetical protein